MDSGTDLMMANKIKRKTKSLRSRFLSLYVFLAILSGIVVPSLSFYFSVNAFRNYQIQRRQAALENLGESLTALYEEEGGTWKRRRVMDILHPAPQWAGMIIQLIDSKGNEVFTLNSSSMNHIMHENNSEYEYITIPLGGEKKVGSLEIRRRLPTGRYENSFIQYLVRYNLAGASIMIILACGFGFLVAGRLSRPVINAIERTKRISKGDYDYNTEEKLNQVGILELDDLTKCVEDLGRSLSAQEKLRRRLMVDVAHELRTPLTVVSTQIEAIADGILDPTPERLNLCMNEMKRLEGLIENVETLTRLEGESIEIHVENINVKNFLEIVIETFRPVFEKSEIKFSSSLEDNLFAEIDQNKFRHVIDNLLSNALRYTNSNGEVNVKAFKHEDNVIIEVSDTGIGISEKDLPNIFERFYRADESRTRVTGGSGVGLAIVKATVEAHGGKITAQSIKGKGSIFKIILPAS